MNAQVADGNTALHYASGLGNKECVTLLLAHGADVNARNDWGYTALHNAAYKGHKEVVELLLAHNVNIDAQIHNEQDCFAFGIGVTDIERWLSSY